MEENEGDKYANEKVRVIMQRGMVLHKERKKKMKRWKRVFAGVLAVALLCMPGYGWKAKAAERKGAYAYVKNQDGKSVTITEYTGDKNSISIPSKIDGMKVTCIWSNVYADCTAKSVVIPNSVKKIANMAFYNCTSLKDVTIPASVEQIWPNAFLNCTSLKKVTIPASVRSIGEHAFGFESRMIFSPFSSHLMFGKISGFTIYGASGSEAENYAKENGFAFRLSSNAGDQLDFSDAWNQPQSKITCKKTLYKVAYGAKPFIIKAASQGRMAFTSSNPKIAAVGKNTGKVTIKRTGVATITIKAGAASKKVTIQVSPKRPAVKSVKTANGRKLAVKWAKDKMASGYQVQVSADRNFKKNVESRNLSKISCTFTDLEAGRSYYVRLRSYKKSGKEALYSAWSRVKLSGKVKR